MIHVKLAGALALVGLVFTSRPWLQFLHTFTPEVGLLIKNALILGVILLLDWIDPSIEFKHGAQALGVLFVYLAFTIIFNYQSDWIRESGSENVGDQTIDGAIYHRARVSIGLQPDVARLLTFVVIPFVLALLGSKFIKNGQKVIVD